MATDDLTDVHPAWLPPEAFRPLGSRRVAGARRRALLVETVAHEVTQALRPVRRRRTTAGRSTWCSRWRAAAPADGAGRLHTGGALGAEGFALCRRGGVTVVLADAPAGLLYGLFHVVRLGEAAFERGPPAGAHRPAMRRRMLTTGTTWPCTR